MKIGILNADAVRAEFVAEFGEYPDMFSQLLKPVGPEIEFVTYEVMNGEYPIDVDEVDGYLITGSKLSVYDEVAWIDELKDIAHEIIIADSRVKSDLLKGYKIVDRITASTVPDLDEFKEFSDVRIYRSVI